MELALAIAFAFAFTLTNGLHDAANAIATLVATRGARPGQAIALATTFNMLGALLAGSAVADTIASIVSVDQAQTIVVIGAGVLAAATWNMITWSRGLPSSSAHALVGGLAGAAFATAGIHAVNAGGLDGWKPVGVLGTLIVLAVSPLLGLGLGYVFARLNARLLRRATKRVGTPIRRSEWVMSAALSFGHGANDAQKTMGVIAAMLLAAGHLDSLTIPLWLKLACGTALTLGTVAGGWPIIRTIGRRIFRLAPVDGFASQSASTAVIVPASFLGAPVSTTQVVAASVVGVGGGRRRWHHIRWTVVRSIVSAWLLTLPASAALGAIIAVIWGAID
jgi:PiT family inorganic phosphate transporter